MADAKTATLRDLIPQPVELPLGAVTLRVAPMGWMQGCAAYDAIEPAISAMPLLGDDARDIGAKVADWTTLVVTFREEVSAFCAIASGQEAADIAALPPTVLVELLMGLIEINVDFFVRSLPDVVARAAGRIQRLQANLLPALERAQAGAFTTPSSG